MPDRRERAALVVIEDSDEDFEALQRALRKAAFSTPVVRYANGSDAIAWLRSLIAEPSDVWPGLILLDLNMPGMDGREVLEQIKNDAQLRSLPIVILTTSTNPSDVASCYGRGANSYMVKPIDMALFQDSVNILCRYWFEVVQRPQLA